MKITSIITALAALVIMTATANAQMIPARTASQTADVVTELTFSASNSSTSMSTQAITKIAGQAISGETSTLIAAMPQISNQLSAQIRTEYASLSNGGSKTFTTGVIKTTASVLEQRSVTMKVTYEPRPIGGILNVTVSLVPTFAGIGGASRPAASRSMSMAVDGISDASINEIITNLTNEVAAQ